MPSTKKQTALSGTKIQSVFAKKSPLQCWTNWPLTQKIATVSASFQMTSSTTSFNSISEQTGPCKATPLAPDSFGGKGWEQTTQPSVSTRMFQKTSAHVTTGHRPPNLQKWKTILVWLTLTEALRKAKRWHDALFGGCWWTKDYGSWKWARDEASPGPSIGDTQTHQIIILGFH